MVRRLVSFQVEVGQGKRRHRDVSDILGGKQKEPIQGLAPAIGLILVEVLYPPNDGGN